MEQSLPRHGAEIGLVQRDVEHRLADEILRGPADRRCGARGDVDDPQVLVDHEDRRTGGRRQTRGDLDPVVRLEVESIAPVREVLLEQRALRATTCRLSDRGSVRPHADRDGFALTIDHPPAEV